LNSKGPLDLVHPRNLADKLGFPTIGYLTRAFPSALLRSIRFRLSRAAQPRSLPSPKTARVGHPERSSRT
jgi:hypothetical protein